jgi:hypothetical protein
MAESSPETRKLLRIPVGRNTRAPLYHTARHNPRSSVRIPFGSRETFHVHSHRSTSPFPAQAVVHAPSRIRRPVFFASIPDCAQRRRRRSELPQRPPGQERASFSPVPPNFGAMSPSIRDSLKFFQAGLSSATQCVKPEARELVGEYDRTGYAARSSAPGASPARTRRRRMPGCADTHARRPLQNGVHPVIIALLLTICPMVTTFRTSRSARPDSGGALPSPPRRDRMAAGSLSNARCAAACSTSFG